jgi:cytochrome c2
MKPFHRLLPLFLAVHLSAGVAVAEAGPPVLELHQERASAFDLAVRGQLPGAPAGETRWLHRSALATLPSSRLKLTGEFVPGEQEVTAVFLDDLWRALPRAAGADTLLATCKDGYAAVYREADFGALRPFLVLEINGQGPAGWPPPGLKFDPGPYVISVSETLAPAVAKLLDPAHKRPWGVDAIEIATYAERFRPVFSGAWARLSSRAQEGRTIWINSCTNCHQGPERMFGGEKSGRPWEVVVAHARWNEIYFRDYVRDPKGVNPCAKMEAHSHYTDAHLAALIAFLSAETGE